MRIQIKGGVWKNTEDEILKAAVMKYGLNQWSRISSLLVRKSAKQCKARWYEWLDPAIKKTEWTREEDEKLLHLAKLMPTQWRTIAPIVGRTPAQCLDRYERLLDMAVSKEDKYDPSDDPRRLRPGEIDPNPESKPARPDPIDMDEEEKEMLSEARARLANTRGKKAKRKARERQMEEARRLASLQKRRELKAAGIELTTKDRSKRSIDYSAEVAFERKPAPGFFDTAEEQAATQALVSEFRPVTLQELEGKRRRDLEEQLIKQDIKRAKVFEAHNMPQAVAQAAAVNDPSMVRRKGRLMLPAPQVSEAELEAIARMSTEAVMDAAMTEEGAGGEATRQLLGEYGPTPMRAPPPPPRTAPVQDRIMQEAHNLAKLQNMATPLVGGEGPDLAPSDFSGITPRTVVAATPNPLLAAATPVPGAAGAAAGGMSVRRGLGPGSTPAIAGVSSTPLRGGSTASVGATPLQTPIRDQLGLNDSDALAMLGVASGKREEARRLAALRAELRAGLGSLPAPQNEYQVVAPELPDEHMEDVEGEVIEEDAAEARARKQREAEERRRLEELKKSKALQRGLPRPASLAHLAAPHPVSQLPQLSLRERAEDELLDEVNKLLMHDATKYPVPPPGLKPDSKEARKAAKAAAAAAAAVVPLEEVPQDQLSAAAELLATEVEHVRRAMGHTSTSHDEYRDTYFSVAKELLWLPSKAQWARVASCTPADRVESHKHEYELARSEMETEARRAAKLEQKVGLLLAGLQQRETKLRKQVDEQWDALQQSNTELTCFQALHEREQLAAPERIEHLVDALTRQQERERLLQDRFKGLLREREELQEQLAAAAAMAPAAVGQV